MVNIRKESHNRLLICLLIKFRSTSVAHTKLHDTAFQETKEDTVTVSYTIKFQLPISSKLVELQQQVAKKLNLEAETYDIIYEDKDGEPILMVNDEDLHEQF